VSAEGVGQPRAQRRVPRLVVREPREAGGDRAAVFAAHTEQVEQLRALVVLTDEIARLTPTARSDTTVANDLRIQQLPARADTLDSFTVAPTLAGGAGGTITGGGAYLIGSSAQFTVTPDAGYTFTGWVVNGTPAGSANPLQVTVTDGLTVEATFVQRFTLQLLHFADGEAGLLASQTAPNLAALADAFDDDYTNTLILSGGDNFIPSPFLNAGTDPALNAVPSVGKTAFARPDIAIHNLVGVEASAIGNHEWDLGTAVFTDAIRSDGAWVGAQFPSVSANLDYSLDSAALGRFNDVTLDGATTAVPDASSRKGRLVPMTVITKGTEKIGVVGVTTQLLRSISSPSGTFVKGFPAGTTGADDMDQLATVLQPYINELLAEGINKIVLLAHLQQLTNERSLATKLTGVDIIVAAGSNTRLGDANDVAVAFPGHAANFADTYPIVTAGVDSKPVLIVNTDNEYTYLGRLVAEFDTAGEIIVSALATKATENGAYAATAANVAAAWGVAESALGTTAFGAGTKGAAVKQVTDAVQSIISAKDGQVYGYTAVYLEGERAFVRSEETNLGNLTADANQDSLRRIVGGSAPIVSLKNGGGIRAQIGAVSSAGGSSTKLPPTANPSVGKSEGGISQLDIENALRFNNRLMAFDTTPAGLKAILEHGVAAYPNQGRFPQIGGVAFAWNPARTAGSRITSITLMNDDGTPGAPIYKEGPLSAAITRAAPATITVITLSFLANNGDTYPMKANGSNFRYVLDNGTLGPVIDEALSFEDAAQVPSKANR
jgi:2',3'-cyclic-nucleotide 2'-phosphodiesterase (5'-nucleotidase family)